MVVQNPKGGVEYDPMAATSRGRVRIAYVDATAEIVDDQLKRGNAGRWELLCDEPAGLGGLDVAPTPLQYFALGVLFWEMTQIARYAQYKKVEIKSVKASIVLNLTMTGSVLAQTIEAGASSVDTNFTIESDAGPEVIRSILINARNGCWARQMIEKPTPFNDTLTLNGETFSF